MDGVFIGGKPSIEYGGRDIQAAPKPVEKREEAEEYLMRNPTF